MIKTMTASACAAGRQDCLATQIRLPGRNLPIPGRFGRRTIGRIIAGTCRIEGQEGQAIAAHAHHDRLVKL
jgi:hypothetical protein